MPSLWLIVVSSQLLYEGWRGPGRQRALCVSSLTETGSSKCLTARPRELLGLTPAPLDDGGGIALSVSSKRPTSNCSNNVIRADDLLNNVHYLAAGAGGIALSVSVIVRRDRHHTHSLALVPSYPPLGIGF